MGEVGVIAALILLVAFFSAIEPAFVSERNLRAILRVVSFVGIIAIGQTMLLIAGEFDLSVGSVAGLSAVVAAKLMTAAALPVPVALLGGLATGALVGLVNGLVVVRLRIPAFIQTLGMLFIGQGLIQVVTNGAPVYPLPPSVGAFGMADVVFGLGWSFVFFVLAAVVADFVLRRTVLGRNMYATGGNAEVARLVGIDTNRYKIGAFSWWCSPPWPACSSWPTSPAAPPRSARLGVSVSRLSSRGKSMRIALEGKRAVILGEGGEIGRAIAAALADNGAQVHPGEETPADAWLLVQISAGLAGGAEDAGEAGRFAAAARAWAPRVGRIIHVISAAGLVPLRGAAAQSAQQAALASLTRALAMELAPGTLVNAVAVGCDPRMVSHTALQAGGDGGGDRARRRCSWRIRRTATRPGM